MKRILAVVVLGACATAAPDSPGITPDGSPPPPPPPGDGPPPADAPPDSPPPPEQVTLQQTADTLVTNGITGCNLGFGVISAISFYRVFPLPEAGVSGVLHVQKVTFGVRQADGTTTLKVKLGTYSGALDTPQLDLNQVTALTETSVDVPDSGTVLVDAPVTVDAPAGSNLVVEITHPASGIFDPLVAFGSTGAAESHRGYIRASQCMGSNDKALSLDQWGVADRRLVINVTGMK
jgi:hypothetical protein